jgi:predicted chitinase
VNVTDLQSNLIGAGYNCGPTGADGDLGPATYRALIGFVSRRDLSASPLGKPLAAEFPKAGIDNRLRIIHALAQACHESGGFRYMQEIGGAAYFARYDGRSDLGNIHPGDGARFHGRGIIQITGRANYRRYGDRLGIDLIAHPERAAEPETAVRIFCAYWTDHRLNALADDDNTAAITRKINGGVNGLIDRQSYVNRLKAVWPA